VIVDSIDSPQGDQVDRTAAATDTRRARTTNRRERDDVMGLLGIGTAAGTVVATERSAPGG
jgi:hypothetical protein